MINYLFSGIDKGNGFTQEQTLYLKSDIKPNSNISFIASIFNNYERNDKQLGQYISIFKNIGIIFSSANIIDDRLSSEDARELISKSDIVFLLGGSPELQMKSICEKDLVDSIKSVKMVLGVSAGSMNQSKRVMYRDDFDNYVLKDYSGLGLVDVNIFPHISLDNDALMNEAKEIGEAIDIIMLPNESFVRVENANVEIIGEHYDLQDFKVIK